MIDTGWSDQQFYTYLESLGITVSERQREQFSAYRELLLSWNQRMNLTAVRTADGVTQRHFADSINCVLATGDLDRCAVIDVGTGAGFPGLPLKILFPSMSLTLVESVQKKCLFLETAVNALGLDQVTIVAERAERVGQMDRYRERFDWAMARAVAELNILVEYLLPLCRLGGAVLAQKGVSAPEEVAGAKTAVSTLGGGDPELFPVTDTALSGEILGFLVKIRKIMKTPDQYPRREGMPKKRPL